MGSKSKIAPRLVVIEGKDKGKIIPLEDGTTVIGRSKGDVIVQDARVSRSHIAIHFDDKLGALTFTDLKSLNGSEINGTLEEKGELKDGDRIQLGDTVFDCQIGAPVDEESSVSKVKEEMRKNADPRRRRTELKGEIPEFEPHLAPLDEVGPETSMPEEPAHLDLMEESDDSAPKAKAKPKPPPKEKKKRRPFVSLGGLGKVVPKVPRRTRNIALGAILILFALSQYTNTGTPGAGAGDPAVNEALRPARELLAQNQAQAALEAAAKVRDTYPEDSRPLLFVGDIFLSQKQYELAWDSYSKAYNLSPFDAVIHVHLARTLLGLAGMEKDEANRNLYAKKASEQITLADERATAGPDSKAIYLALGRLYLDYPSLPGGPKKMMILAKAIQQEHAPRSALGYQLEAKALMSTRQNEEALVVLQRARDLDSKDPWTLENLVFTHLATQNVEGAEKVLQEWIQFAPNASKALLVLSYIKMNAKKYREALPYVQRIVSNGQKNPQDPHLPEAVHLMGQIYYAEGQNEEAATLFQQACRAGFKKSCEAELAIQQPQDSPAPKKQTK